MGGTGSGPTGGSRYHTVGSAHHLDLAQLLRTLRPEPGGRRVSGWGWGGHSVLLDVDLDECCYRIRYQAVIGDEAPRVESRVELAGDLLQTFPHYGGVRWWWACPSCEQRVRILYKPPPAIRFACRRCHHLRYFSQRLSPFYRLRHRSDKLYAKAGRSLLDRTSLVTKRKGMHWRTFDRLMAEGDDAERLAFHLLTQSFFTRFPGFR